MPCMMEDSDLPVFMAVVMEFIEGAVFAEVSRESVGDLFWVGHVPDFLLLFRGPYPKDFLGWKSLQENSLSRTMGFWLSNKQSI